MRATLRRDDVEEVDEDLDVDEQEPKSKGRKWTLYGSFGVFGVVAVCAVAFFILPSPGKEQPFTGPVVAVPAVGADVAAGPCNFPAQDTSTLVTIAPPDVVWNLAGSMASPSSATAGPASRGPVPSCYARTPQGALMAASNWITTMNNPAVDKTAAVQALVAHTSGYEQYLANFESAGTAAGDDPSVQQIAAFRMIFWDQSHAEIEIVNRATSGNSPGFMASVVYVLVWENDDWKIAPVLDGDVPITRVIDAIEPPFIAFNGA